MAPGIVNRVASLFGRRAAAPEARAFLSGPAGYSLNTGPRASPALAENLATVTACVNAISSAIASMPARVYRSVADGNGRVEVPGHPIARLVRAPNDRQTWPQFCEWWVSQTLLWGNGLASIEYDGRGAPTALVPIPWQFVSPVVLASGRLAFDVVAYSTPLGVSGIPRRLLVDDCLFLADRSDDGWIGRSRISRAPAVIAAASGLQEYTQAIWRNAATPSGAVKLPQSITPDGLKRAETFFAQRNTGAANGGSVLFMDAGSDWVPLGMSPEDAEVLASRRFSGEELCRLYGVPPALAGDLSHGTFTNSETAGRWFAQFTVSPWLAKMEAEFARALFADSSAHVEFDMSSLVRGSYTERWTANVAAVTAGILTQNEVREAEGYNPITGGDTLRTPVAALSAPVKEPAP